MASAIGHTVRGPPRTKLNVRRAPTCAATERQSVAARRMPHTSLGGLPGAAGDDLGSTDEVKVFKDEGDKEDENVSSENLLEEKSSLIDLTESEVRCSNVLKNFFFWFFIFY